MTDSNIHNIWREYEKRDDDIIIASTIKSGTTWMQQIVAQIVFSGEFDGELGKTSFWIDSQLCFDKSEILKMLDEQDHRRFLKTHSAAQLAMQNRNKQNRYIFITRDFRDVVWSHFNHIKHYPEELKENLHNDFVRYLYDAEDEVDLWHRVLSDRDAGDNIFRSTRSYFEVVRSWLNHRNDPNVLILHYNNLKADLKGNVKKISEFLGYDHDEDVIDKITTKSTFTWMKSNAERCVPHDFTLNGTSTNFINKGVNKKWEGKLTEEDLKMYDNRLESLFTPQETQWVKTGEWL